MRKKDYLAGMIRQAVRKDYAYLAYHLPYGENRGTLEVEGEKIETKPYSFTEMSDMVREAYEEAYPVKHVEPMGFRGEIFVSEEKELEIYATGSLSLIEYKIRVRKT